MKMIFSFLMILTVALLSSCSSTSKFPVSEAAPAATITAKTKKQGGDNHLVTITALNLAASNRLIPSKKLYVIWAVSRSGVIRNVGYFVQKNAVKSTYKASFPYEPVEIFITAEDDEGLCYPEGIEITRTKL